MTKLTIKLPQDLSILFFDAASSQGFSRERVIKAMIQAYTRGRINIVDMETGELKRQVDMTLDGRKPPKPQPKATTGNQTELTKGTE